MALSTLKEKNYSYDIVPAELLHYILKPLPLQQRIGLRAVSKQWKEVLEDDLQEETTLCIRDEEYTFEQIPEDRLLIKPDYFTVDLVRTLVGLMPEVTEVDIIGNSKSAVVVLPELLAPYDNLMSLSIDLETGWYCKSTTVNTAIDRLAEIINAKADLISLSLEGYGEIRALLLNLEPTLVELERFSIKLFDGVPKDKLATFLSNSLSPKCTHLTTNQVIPFGFTDWADTLTHLKVEFVDLKLFDIFNCCERLESFHYHNNTVGLFLHILPIFSFINTISPYRL